MTAQEPIIEVKNLKTYLGGNWVNNDLSMTIFKGEIVGIAGGSGSGKTTLLREILVLQKPDSGSVRVFNQNVLKLSPIEILKIQCRIGVLFQQNALFSSRNILENVSFPLHEHTALDDTTIKELALLKIIAVGLPESAAIKYPSELSGGMQKRAALARAIVLDPELLFLDEPTAGLDPESAAGLDDLILTLQSTMGLTIVMVTHDLDSLWATTNRVAFLGEGKVLCIDALPKLVENKNPLIQAFFNGPRGRMAAETNK